MHEKKTVWMWLVCLMLWLSAGIVWAGTGGGMVAVTGDGPSEIQIGIAVDYMGKLRFEVLERGTERPIPNASVELFIPSLNRYVLTGTTDSNGIFELDVAYGNHPDNEDGIVRGSLLYLNNKEIAYQVYKSQWLPYPYVGSTILETNPLPQTITIHLYQDKPSGGGGGGKSSGKEAETIGDIVPFPVESVPADAYTPHGGIPKTGVEGTAAYWLSGLVFFLLAGTILGYLLKKERDIRKRERGE